MYKDAYRRLLTTRLTRDRLSSMRNTADGDMFDAQRWLLSTFGTVDGLLSSTKQYYGASPERGTARKWFERGSVPSTWLPILIVVAERREGRPLMLSNFVDGGTCNGIFG